MRFRTGIKFLLIIIMLMVINASTLVLPALGYVKKHGEDKRQVLIIDFPRFDFTDVTKSYPTFWQLLQSSSAGILNASFTEAVSNGDIYLAFNSDTLLKSSDEACGFYNVTENYKGLQAGKLYHTLTGYEVSDYNGVALGLARLVQLNSSTIVKNIGLYGRLLHEHALKTGIIGNSDADIFSRLGAMLIMDQKGKVDFSAVGRESTLNDPFFPYETRSDIAKVHAIYKDFKNKADVIVITLGDLERVERGYLNLNLSESRRQFYRRQVLKNYDNFLAQLLKEINLKTTLVILFNPMPSLEYSPDNAVLNPVIISGTGFGHGILFSGSTKKAGIVTSHDLTATIFNFLKIKTDKLIGKNLKSVSGNWRTIELETKKLVKNYQFRWPLLSVLGYLLIGLVLLTVLGFILAGENQWIFKWQGFIYLFLLTVPVAFLMEAVINPLNWISIISWTMGLGGLIFLGSFFLGKRDFLKALSILSFITVIMIMVDSLLNGYFELKSFLGYSVFADARFYGIGDEYLGILIGAFTVFISLNYESMGIHLRAYREKILWLIVCVIAIFLTHPNLGANISGGITFLLGSGITIYILTGRRVGLKEIGGLLAAVVALLLMTVFWNIYTSDSFSTYGSQFLGFLKTNGASKWDLNLRLITYTFWSKVLICILLFVPLLYKKPPSLVKKFLIKRLYIGRGFTGIAFSALIALIINDGGVISVATMFIFGVAMLILTIFKEWVFQKGVEN